jgi:thymidylate synthase
MYLIDTANVHQALPEGCRLILANSWETTTRNGKAKVLREPLATVYRQPTQRVLFWEKRDANPFFHFMECLWMMAGRRDVEWIARFSSNIKNYSDDGQVFNGAYGHRWRHYFGVDQLATIIRNLRVNPACRRQVLTMWSASDLTHQDTKDVPCNTQAYLQVSRDGYLDLMVSNRSNDMIWGAYGANAVHFSFLLEVMAAFIEVRVGTYTQVSMNTHVYEPHFALAEAMADLAPDVLARQRHQDACPYDRGEVKPYPVVANTRWFTELEAFMVGTTRGYTNPFFPEVALPLLNAWGIYKEKDLDRALSAVAECAATDWKLAATDWLLRRRTRTP